MSAKNYREVRKNRASDHQIGYLKELVNRYPDCFLCVEYDDLDSEHADKAIRLLLTRPLDELIGKSILLKVFDDSALLESPIVLTLEGNMHLWGWDNFRGITEARLLEYDTDKNVINRIKYEFDRMPSADILSRYGLKITDKEL